jgi:tRNA (mo5U34)-methyltransferase
MTETRIRERSWYHTLEFPDGTTTPGYFDLRGIPDQLQWPAGLRGGRCLDVGTFDGFWAFELERRGAAEVVALDIDDPTQLDWRYDERDAGPRAVRLWGAERGPGFTEARDRMSSKAERLVVSVYDLDPEVHGRFDVVFLGALLLHLRDPVRALERIREVCRGDLLVLETIDPYLDLVARRRPSARLRAERGDEWWLVNGAGLVAMITLAGFHVEWVGRRILVPFGDGVTSPPRANLAGVAARRPGAKGALHLPLRARPRPPASTL